MADESTLWDSDGLLKALVGLLNLQYVRWFLYPRWLRLVALPEASFRQHLPGRFGARRIIVTTSFL